jgi:glutamate carboxypeptidase
MAPKKLLDICEPELPWMLDTLEKLIRLESPTGDKAAVDRCGLEIRSLVEAMGGHVRILGSSTSGNHLRAEFGRGAGQLLLLGHFDTVWPVGQISRMPLLREGDRFYGPGTLDMKGGIVIGLQAIRCLQATGRMPSDRIVMLLTADEETGSASSRHHIESEARRSAAVLVLEPALPGGALKTARKGCGQFELAVKGVAAHAGVAPGEGVSAIHELARLILRLERLRDPAAGISVNVGVIEGGTRANVVAETARAAVDIRIGHREDAARVEAAVRGLTAETPGATVEVSGGIERPPMERTTHIAQLFALARDVATSLGRDLGEGSTGGGSDGNFTASMGVPTLDGLGAVGDGAHALHEHVEIGSLAWRAALLAGLLERVGCRSSRDLDCTVLPR